MRRMTLFLVIVFAALAFGGSFECRSDHDDDDDDAIVTVSMREAELPAETFVSHSSEREFAADYADDADQGRGTDRPASLFCICSF